MDVFFNTKVEWLTFKVSFKAISGKCASKMMPFDYQRCDNYQ